MITVKYSSVDDMVTITMSHEEAIDYYLGETEGTMSPDVANKILELMGKVIIIPEVTEDDE